MFEKVRKPNRAKGIVAYMIFGAIILVFIGFGVVPAQMGRDVTGVAATVNRSQITLADFRERVQMLERQYQAQLDQIPAAQKVEFSKQVRMRALEDLIGREVMVQQADELGLKVTDHEVRDILTQIQVFQDEGKFKRENYDRYLKSAQLTPGQFEDKLRKDLMMGKLRNLFQEALRPSNVEQKMGNLAESTKVEFEIARWSDEDLKKKVQITGTEIKSWLSDEKNKAEVKKAYEANPLQFSEPEKVLARHILIRVDRNQADSDAKAKAKIEELKQRAEKGEDFAKLATEYTEDTASKKDGGSLGYFSKGRMVPEFENAAFQTAPGQLSPPVKTDFGYHLIKVEDKKPAIQKTLEQAEETLARNLMAESKFKTVLKDLEEKVTKGSESEFRNQLKSLKIEVTPTGQISLDSNQIPGVGDADKIFGAMIKSKVKKGLIPELIREGDQYFAVSVKSLLTSEGSKEMLSDYVSSRKFSEAFGAWIKTGYEKAAIQRNSQIIN